MTSYFDDASRLVREIPRDLSRDEYLARIAEVERPIVLDVNLCTGDREFPDDLREKIQGIIAVKSLFRQTEIPCSDEAVDWALTLHYSSLIEDLHSAFHALASRRAETRWGRWSDSPRANLVARKDHDEPEVL